MTNLIGKCTFYGVKSHKTEYKGTTPTPKGHPEQGDSTAEESESIHWAELSSPGK